MNRLAKIDLTGFKSIQELKDFELLNLNVFIGANGAGKSNLVDFFRMLSWMSTGRLREFVGKKGGANNLLFEGAAKTPDLGIKLTVETDNKTNEYEARLSHADGDSLVFAEEKWNSQELGTSHAESRIIRGYGRALTALGRSAVS